MNLYPTAPLSSPIYDNPIPGREFILSLFGKMKKNLNREQIAHALKLSNAEQKEALRRRLRAMERDGQLMFSQRKGYQIIDPSLLISGVITLHKDGFGFVKFSTTEKDLFIPKTQLTHVFEGDVVQVLLDATNTKRSNNKLIKIIERKTTHLAGILKRQGKGYVLVADNTKCPQKVQVEQCSLTNSSVGQYVNTKITQYPTFRQATQVQITEVLGLPHSAGMETKLALRRHGVSDNWEPALLTQASSFGNKVTELDKLARVDYRLFPFVTIDGEDAKDFDDAVYCERTEQGDWRLLVAIADVSHYVKPNDVLDLEAQQRATSIYCPGQVIPMLPEALSNGLCSLNPHEDRLVLVCDMTINSNGHVSQANFTEGLIHSHARLTYNQAHTIITEPNTNLNKKIAESDASVPPLIKNLHALYVDLNEARKHRGAIDFDTQELKLNLNKNQKITSIEPVERNDAHKMIEEFMLCANVCTAQFLDKHQIPGLFRVHAGPQQKKLFLLRTLLAEKGLKLGGGDKPTSAHYNKLLNTISSRSDASIIRTLLLRSQSQAEYCANNLGHFGLAYDAYTHFTSPIRRYADLVTHRAIRAQIKAKQQNSLQRVMSYLNVFANKTSAKSTLCKKAYPYDLQSIETLSMHCSTQSRKANEISREVESALKCSYMNQYIGDTFTATISGVSSTGLFVELDTNSVEGLVPASSFNEGGCVFNAEKQQWRNDTKRFALGDRVSVTLKSIDLRERKMSFLLSNFTFH
ncbi:ribonuclease R [Pseudoalteromonas aliena]|uniref:Ribonuclease R n=1 Tax=Pseudoalteromonas aliena TaxID=247523 RepID=A0A1Q2GXA6_9GAMM|nr:ribonuclease R [Pseudoalteromonas aliena]AQP99722.1 ribonuclease R [Pseudoalteromonas aliena]